MQIYEVKGVVYEKDFIRFPKELYRNDPFWVCPLDKEVEAVFDPLRNHAFGHGEAIRWILKDEKQKTIGRIAAFIDYVRSKANNQPTGGIGYFEVIDRRDAAFLLFDTARDWLASKKMEAMDGPINFGEMIITGGSWLKGSCSRASECRIIKSITGLFLKSMALKNTSTSILTIGQYEDQIKKLWNSLSE